MLNNICGTCVGTPNGTNFLISDILAFLAQNISPRSATLFLLLEVIVHLISLNASLERCNESFSLTVHSASANVIEDNFWTPEYRNYRRVTF